MNSKTKWIDGALIRKLRKDRDLTTRELGELSGVAGKTIENYERGASDLSVGSLKRVADALGVSVDSLYRDIY